MVPNLSFVNFGFYLVIIIATIFKRLINLDDNIKLKLRYFDNFLVFGHGI